MSENDSQPIIKSYELVTDELVKETLRNDKGENAEVLSWEIKDFTKKGDGYMSIVSSIYVKYIENGNEADESYVVKLNPLRPASSMSDLSEELFGREPVILSDVIRRMSKHLEILGLTRIKTPAIYAFLKNKGKEAFVTENLRKQGFIMHDRKKGQDFDHSILVMEELGRFHASSLLLEETLAPKTFEETFENFKETWLDLSSPSFKTMEAVLKSQAESAINNYLNEIPKYEKCVKWLKTNIESLGHNFIDGWKPDKSFNVLVHGDCWTNNMLFKYNDRNKPVDIRFVDLQCSRKASPASDIAYFTFSSLNGEIRSKYMKELLLSYYQSFTRILILAKKKIPFTFKELENELEKRKIFGFVSGLMIVGNALFTEGDEIMDLENFTDEKLSELAAEQAKNFKKFAERESSFKDRLLSLFDEMLVSPIFEI